MDKKRGSFKKKIGIRFLVFVAILLAFSIMFLFLRDSLMRIIKNNHYSKLSQSIEASIPYISSDVANGVSADALTALSKGISARVLTVDTNYLVTFDSDGVLTNTYMVDEDVNAVIGGESDLISYTLDTNMYYFFPVTNEDENVVAAVVIAASTVEIENELIYLRYRANILICIFAIITLAWAFGLAYTVGLDNKRIRERIIEMKNGFLGQIDDGGLFKDGVELTSEINQVFVKAQALEDSRQEFVSNVSHELKTPITSMKVLSESILMQEDVPAEMYREFMNDIVLEIDREAQIISDLLTLVKTDKGSDSLNLEPVDVNELMDVIVKRLKPIASKRDIAINYESFHEVTAEIDKVKFTLAISNLIENGIKYNVDGGQVFVTLNADHKNLYIKVADTGVGIPEDCLDHIFERFYRVDKARSRDTGGTGLGLALARNIILMHKGNINVYSEQGKGTTFTVRVPSIKA